MKRLGSAALLVSAALALTAMTSSASERMRPLSTGKARYDTTGRLILPPDFREWTFLSAGLDMNYGSSSASSSRHVFGNVFVPPAAYRRFRRTGVWPDGTVLILEDRLGSSKGSINKAGHFQTGVVGLEAHVKDTHRFKGGWGFFAFENSKPADLIGYGVACYSCHRDHAAADTTFVQFYPTLLPSARATGHLSRSYLQAETSDAAVR